MLTLNVNHVKHIVGNMNIDGNLSTKDSRTAWEAAFMTTYLNAVISVSFYNKRYNFPPLNMLAFADAKCLQSCKRNFHKFRE